MNNYLAIRDDIKTKLETIAGVGIVHGRSRLAADWGTFLARFKDPSTGRINGWEITRKGVSERRSGPILRQHAFVLRGYLGIQDEAATDETFQQLVEEVCNLFRDAQAPAGASWLYHNSDDPEDAPAQVPKIEERTFGAVLCHYCEIHLAVTERLLPTF